MLVRRLILTGLVALAGLLTVASAASAGLPGRLPLWTDWYHPTALQDSWNDVAVGPGHRVYVCGTQGLTQGPGADMVVTRYGAGGPKPVWRVTWDGGGSFAQGQALAVDKKGDVVVCGSSGLAGRGYAVVKFSGKDGHVVWARDFGDAPVNWAVDVAVDASNNVYVTGDMLGGALTGNAIVTVKFNAAGAQSWKTSYEGAMLSSEVQALAVDAQRNVFVTGTTQTATGSDWLTLRISPGGKQLWKRVWDGSAHGTDMATRLVLSKTGAVYVAGESQQSDVNDSDVVVIRYSRSGAVYWVKQFARPDSADTLSEMCLGSSGDLLLCGVLRPIDPTAAVKAWACGVKPAGKTRWSKASPSRTNPQGGMWYADLAPGPGGSMYVSGSVQPSAGDTDILVEKRSVKGALVWSAVLGWPDGLDDAGGALALDGTSGLYVTGRVDTAAGFIDALLMKYKP